MGIEHLMSYENRLLYIGKYLSEASSSNDSNRFTKVVSEIPRILGPFIPDGLVTCLIPGNEHDDKVDHAIQPMIDYAADCVMRSFLGTFEEYLWHDVASAENLLDKEGITFMGPIQHSRCIIANVWIKEIVYHVDGKNRCMHSHCVHGNSLKQSHINFNTPVAFEIDNGDTMIPFKLRFTKGLTRVRAVKSDGDIPYNEMVFAYYCMRELEAEEYRKCSDIVDELIPLISSESRSDFIKRAYLKEVPKKLPKDANPNDFLHIPLFDIDRNIAFTKKQYAKLWE